MKNRPIVRSTRWSILRRILVSVLGVTGTLFGQEAAPEPGAEEPPIPKVTPGTAPPVTPEERQQLIAFVREVYAKPPAEWPAPTLDPGRPHRELGAVSEPPPSPTDNPASPEKARLGLSLFFDVRLSGAQQIACVTCHDPQLAWSNAVTFSFGVGRQVIKRHPPTLIGAGFHSSLFWDGRAASLEAQAHDVITNPSEMAGDPTAIVERLSAEKTFYGPLFTKAFGDDQVTFERVLLAIGAFERTIPAGRTRFDKFVKGKPDALTDSELAGLHLFRTKARCINCHMGPMFTDDEFHNLGLTYYGRKFEDLGRYNVTALAADVGKFRTPTLRNVDRSAPYMHNGIFPTLEGVLRLYNAGMAHPKPRENQKDDPLFPQTSELLKPLKLTAEELADLRAFLTTLTEPPTRVLFPPVPPLKTTLPVAVSPTP